MSKAEAARSCAISSSSPPPCSRSPLSGLVLIGLLISIVPLIQWMPGLFIDGNDVEIRTFLERALDIVIGIEFIKMLAKHSPGPAWRCCCTPSPAIWSSATNPPLKTC